MASPVAGIVLAAGASRRMGRPKALLPVGPDTFVTRLVRTLRLAGAQPVLAVAGTNAPDVEAVLAGAGLSASVVVNPAPEHGQLSSLLVALDALEAAGTDVDGALVCLVDAPLVQPATVSALIDAFRRTGAPVVRPASGERHGHPVLFSRTVFGELRGADPAAGAKTVVRAHARESVDVVVDDPGAFIDIDTPEEYERWIIDRRAEAPRHDNVHSGE